MLRSLGGSRKGRAEPQNVLCIASPHGPSKAVFRRAAASTAALFLLSLRLAVPPTPVGSCGPGSEAHCPSWLSLARHWHQGGGEGQPASSSSLLGSSGQEER